MEDYCHAVEHSIEFQVVFLQHLFGASVRILPILCGSYAPVFMRAACPRIRRAPPASSELSATWQHARATSSAGCWVLTWRTWAIVRRSAARARRSRRDAGVAERDRKRIESINAGDATGFWEQVRENHDDLKWCGSSPVYTFLKALPQARGTLRKYQQWNIDEQSVVSFAGMSFAD